MKQNSSLIPALVDSSRIAASIFIAGSFILILGTSNFCLAQENAPIAKSTENEVAPEEDLPQVDFARQILPILAKNCFSCHGTDTKESGLALHEFASAASPAESGAIAIVPKAPSSSELLTRVRSKDPSVRMPPEGEGLTDGQIKLLETWIESGAEYKAHWAFVPLSNPAIPKVQSADDQFARSNPIDAFIAKSWAKKGLHTSGPADPRALVRRLYFDCLGIPPETEVVEAFAADPSDAAYEALVDQLLADPRFGERMARDWLDLVRYAETNSYERDGSKPNAYFYRDYVIHAFNSDKSYRTFLIEQLAGDEIENPTTESLTATGFYRLGIWDDEPADPLQARFDGFDDLVTTVGQGLLGLTVNCARCHDHKIDPIPAKDYYQLVAFLRDVTPYGNRGDEKSNSQIDISSPDAMRQVAELKEKIQKIRSQRRDLEGKGIATMSREDKIAARSPDRNKVIDAKLKEHLSNEDWAQYESLKSELETATKTLEQLPRQFRLGLAKCEVKPPETHILLRGSPQAEGDVVKPGFPQIFQEEPPIIPDAGDNAKSAGRRIVLAKWLTQDSNRLTTRVIVNRIWQHHFGRGIVRSSNNFGQMGDPPTHPELLDFLAQELVRSDWHLKPLHRLMLLSQTYRQSSFSSDATIDIDPQNDLFARFNPRRLSAEELRDSVLAVSGRIDYSKFGKSIYPDVSDDVKAGQSVPGSGWEKSSERDQSRRSIYIYIKRSLVPPELSAFDFPETDVTCEARFLTTQAAQALNMLNGSFIQKHATHLADYAARSRSNLADRLTLAIETAFCRPCHPDDLARASNRVKMLQNKYSLSESAAFREYCLVLLNSNEFVYLD